MALIIIVCILILILICFLLFCRIRLMLDYSGEIKIKIRYLFFSFGIMGYDKGKARKEKKKKKRHKKEPEEKKPDITLLLREISKYSDKLRNMAGSTLKRLRIDTLTVKLIIKEEDAAKTAILYGEACSAIYPAVSFLACKAHLKSYEITIIPLFSEGEAEAVFKCALSIRLGSIIFLGLTQGLAFFFTIIRDLNRNKTKEGVIR